jgi:Ca2+-binding EF-hand superfamily protein
MNEFDLNKDGRITKDEFLSAMAKLLNEKEDHNDGSNV